MEEGVSKRRNMYEVIVLKEGYTKPVKRGSMKAGGTITLLKGPKVIVVDTGSPWDKDLLLTGLTANNLSPELVDYVICSHGHSDHVGNLNLFPSSIHIVSYDISQKDEYLKHDFSQGIPYEIDEDLEIWPTPGHTGSDVSVIVRGTKHGTVAVTGDLFECFEDLDDPDIWQTNSERPNLQEQSRIEILRIADYIVPGHGSMFKVPSEYRQQMRVVMMQHEYSYYQSSGEGCVTNMSSMAEYVVLESE